MSCLSPSADDGGPPWCCCCCCCNFCLSSDSVSLPSLLSCSTHLSTSEASKVEPGVIAPVSPGDTVSTPLAWWSNSDLERGDFGGGGVAAARWPRPPPPPPPPPRPPSPELLWRGARWRRLQK